MTLFAKFETAAASWPDAQAIFWIDGHEHAVSLSRLFESATRVAGWLRSIGVGRGDRVILQLAYGEENMVFTIALLHLGAVLVPVPQIYGNRELEYTIRNAAARLLIMPSTWRSVDMMRRADDLLESTPLDHVAMIGDVEDRARLTSWATIAAYGEAAPPGAVDEDDVTVILYTSGTSSEPKAVRHSHRSLSHLMEGLIRNLRTGDAQNFLACFPPGHIGGLITMLRPAFDPGTNVYMDRWDGEAALALIHAHDISLSQGGPFFLRSLLDAAAVTGTGPLRLYLCGGANVPPALIKEAASKGLTAVRSYGSTEHPMLTYGLPGDPLDKRAETDGRCVSGEKLIIVDDELQPLPAGQVGEIATRGKALFQGYGVELATSGLTDSGWFLTGDIGRLDAEGYLQVVDRKKDIIIRGGENISSMEVEQMLCLHDGISDAAVVGLPDAIYGERVCAFIQTRPGYSIDTAELIRHFDSLGATRQKTPERVITVEDFPRTASGKVIKGELRRQITPTG